MNNAIRNVINLVLVASLAGGIIAQISNNGSSYKLYYGLMHAHCMISDGVGTPEEAFTKARNAGLDFFAITPHNHAACESGAKERRDGLMIATDHRLYNSSALVNITRTFKRDDRSITENITLKSLIMAARDITSSEFLGIYGQEFSTISTGNHMNVFGFDDVIRTTNGDFKDLISLAETAESNGASIILQMNHPDVQGDLFYSGSNIDLLDEMNNDYGIDGGDLGPSFSSMISRTDHFIKLIEVLSGPAMKKERIENYRYTDPHENDYYFYLKQGFHMAPSAGQDNHYDTWGVMNDARMGVYARSLSPEDIFEAISHYRTFATEDKNLAVKFAINNSFMGSMITLNAEGSLNVTVELQDDDEPNIDYEIQLIGGTIEAQNSQNATNWKLRDGVLYDTLVKGDGTYFIQSLLTTGSPEFYFIKLIQQDDDRAWTSPVWINYPEAGISTSLTAGSTVADATPKFFWSKNSTGHVFHRTGCPTIIKPENLQSGSTPPEGWRQHKCPVHSEVDD